MSVTIQQQNSHHPTLDIVGIEHCFSGGTLNCFDVRLAKTSPTVTRKNTVWFCLREATDDAVQEPLRKDSINGVARNGQYSCTRDIVWQGILRKRKEPRKKETLKGIFSVCDTNIVRIPKTKLRSSTQP